MWHPLTVQFFTVSVPRYLGGWLGIRVTDEGVVVTLRHVHVDGSLRVFPIDLKRWLGWKWEVHIVDFSFYHSHKELCKVKNQKIRVKYGSVWVSISNFFLKSSQNSPKPVLIFRSSIPRVFCLYTLLKVVSYYDLIVQSMSVKGFQKQSLDGGWVCGVSSIQFLIYFGIFLTLQSP